MPNTNTLRATQYPNNFRTISGVGNGVFDNDVVLNCNTSGGSVGIDLAMIVENYWSVQYRLYVTDLSNNAATNNITINAPVGYTINGASTYVINTNGASIEVFIVSNTSYGVSNAISDEAYGVSWDGVTTVGASKNALYDIINSLPTPTNQISDNPYNSSWDGVTTVGASKNALYDIINIQTKTYSELQALVSGNGLIKGRIYLLSDFALKYSVEGATVGTTLSSDEAGITAQVEPLILLATDINTFSPQAFSTLHSNDIVYYDITASTITVTSGTYQRKGNIYRRIDTSRRIDIAWDWRYKRFTRSTPLLINGASLASLAWNVATPYVKGDFSIEANIIYICLKNVTGGAVPSSNSSWMITNIDVREHTLCNSFYGSRMTCTYGTQYYYYTFSLGVNFVTNVADNVGIYDISILGGDNNVFYGTSFYKNKISFGFTNNSIKVLFTENSIGSGFNQNNIGIYFKGNNIDFGFDKNIVNSISWNNISPAFANNILNSSSYNNISSQFQSNVIGGGFDVNNISTGFVSNFIGTGCSINFFGNNNFNNSIGTGFVHNTIGNNFTSNTIGNTFADNTIGNQFELNTVGAGFAVNTVKNRIISKDFTAWTNVYSQDVECTIQKRLDQTIVGSYINNANATITATTV